MKNPRIAIIVTIFAILIGVGTFVTSTLTSGGRNVKQASEKPKKNTIPGSQQNEIKIKNFSFIPNSVTIPVGTTVTWTNHNDSPHTIVADNGDFKSPTLKRDQTFSYTYESTGLFTYHCSSHASEKGKVIVE